MSDKPMTVGEVMEKLQGVDPNLPVLVGHAYTIDLRYFDIEVKKCEKVSWETSNFLPDLEDVDMCVFNPTRGLNGEPSEFRIQKDDL